MNDSVLGIENNTYICAKQCRESQNMPEILEFLGSHSSFIAGSMSRFTSTLKEMMVTRCLILLGMISFFGRSMESKPMI